MNVLSLFTGIGGLDLGLERAAMSVVGQVEIDEYCRRVLAKHWPDVPRHDDVRTCVDWWRAEPRPPVHVVAGGFPCQPFSSAGRRGGVGDARWGWPWMLDVVRHLRPRYVLVENVADLVRDRDAFGTVLGDLATLGFDAEWSLLSACAMGAPHTRERLFVVAHTPSDHGEDPRPLHPQTRRLRPEPRRGRGAARRACWLPEPPLDRVAVGAARRLVVDELHALGNTVVPQVAEHVGRLITGRAA